jgi:putative N6-adenine-specific DNA methylase
VDYVAYAITAPGLEALAERELRANGLTPGSTTRGGVEFAANPETLADALMQVRTITRIVIRIAEFRATSFAQLEQRANRVPWRSWVGANDRMQFRVTCRKSRLYHSDAVAERLARAVVKACPGAQVIASAAEDEDESDAQLFVVRVADDVCTISADASGAALHRRGYRLATAKAPLRETLAAAMLLGAGWPAQGFVDPLCGAGTLPIEAAMIARRIAPGINRAFRAERWPHTHARVWKGVRERARAMIEPGAGVPIVGGDRDSGAIAAALANAERAGVVKDVRLVEQPMSAAKAPAPAGLIATNPPYGVRIGETAELRDLYARFGAIVRREFAGWTCAVLSADRSPGHTLERKMSLPFQVAWTSANGGIPVRLLVAAPKPR